MACDQAGSRIESAGGVLLGDLVGAALSPGPSPSVSYTHLTLPTILLV